MQIIQLRNLQNSFSSHNTLAEISELCANTNDDILLDFKNVSFMAANQFAILGSILHDCHVSVQGRKIGVANIPKKLKSTIRKNGFADYIGLQKTKDIYNTTIPYKIFDTSEINEFERHLVISLFSRDDLPTMSLGVQNAILDNLLEIFNNVTNHAHTNLVFTCGQYFPKRHILYLTISDVGKTIQKNVEEYFYEMNKDTPNECLKWAMQSGHSTRQTDSPGGLGLTIISEFIEKNKGELYILSGSETFEINSKGKRYKTFDHYFRGTAVTIGFNLKDDSIYILEKEDIQQDLLGGML